MKPSSKKRAAEEAVTRAVDELNHRLSTTHRRMVQLTTLASVVAGLAAGGWTMSTLQFEPMAFRLVVPVFLVAALATFALGGLLVQGMLGGLKGGWARSLARETGADPDEVLSFALPFGGPPGREGARSVWRRAAAICGATLVTVLAIGMLVDWQAAIRVASTIVIATSTAAFWGYLGMRAPR